MIELLEPADDDVLLLQDLSRHANDRIRLVIQDTVDLLPEHLVASLHVSFLRNMLESVSYLPAYPEQKKLRNLFVERGVNVDNAADLKAALKGHPQEAELTARLNTVFEEALVFTGLFAAYADPVKAQGAFMRIYGRTYQASIAFMAAPHRISEEMN